MIKNIFLLTTLGLVTTTLATLSGADEESAINPRDTFDIMDGHDAVSRITDNVLSDGLRFGTISAINKADDDDATDDLQDLLIGFSTDIENGYLAGVIINFEETNVEVREIILKGEYNTEIGDIIGEFARLSRDSDKVSVTAAKIALDADYNDLSVDGMLVYQVVTNTAGEDDEESYASDVLVSYPITDGLSATANIRMVSHDDLGLDEQADMTMFLIGLKGSMDVGENVTLHARANVGTTDGTETDAADDETDVEEEIIQWSAGAKFSNDTINFNAAIGQISSDNGTETSDDDTLHQEFNAEASYDVNQDLSVVVYALIQQELLASNVVDTETSIGGIMEYSVTDDISLSAILNLYNYDHETTNTLDEEKTEVGASLTYDF